MFEIYKYLFVICVVVVISCLFYKLDEWLIIWWCYVLFIYILRFWECVMYCVGNSDVFDWKFYE